MAGRDALDQPTEGIMGIVNQGSWCQASVSTGTAGIRTASSILKREGYQVSVSSMGMQVTHVGLIKMSLINVRPGQHDDTFGASAILRSYIPELRT